MKKVSFGSLILLMFAAVTSIRNFPPTALFGSSLVFYCSLAALMFLIPIALASAELSSTFPDEGGVFHWVRYAMGERWAVMAIWLQWINTVIWYPTMLAFVAGCVAYGIDPQLAQNKMYVMGFIWVVTWIMTFLGLRGIRTSVRVNDICSIVGIFIPIILLVILALLWWGRGNTIALDTTWWPSWTRNDHWEVIVAIMASFLGMELAGVHVGDIAKPERNFPRALFVASIGVLAMMIVGSMAIAWVIPAEDLQLASGVMQVFDRFFHAFGLERWMGVIALAIALGAVGGLISWLISPARGLLSAAQLGYLPRSFARVNQWGVSPQILIAQGVFITLFSLPLTLIPSINGFYWLLMALSTEMYMIMYILVFLSVPLLRRKSLGGAFRIPGGKSGVAMVTGLGIVSCIGTVGVTFLPPERLEMGRFSYGGMILMGSVIALAPLLLFFGYKAHARKKERA